MAKAKESMEKFEAKDGNKLDYFKVQVDEKAPTIMVVSEIWGLTEFIRSFSRRVSELGYNTIAPDLYSRPGDKELFTESNIMDAMRPMWSLPPEKRRDPKAIEEVMAKLSPTSKKIFEYVSQKREEMEKRMIDDLDSLYKGHMGSSPKKGIVGFCMGGGLAFQLSTMVHFDASVIFYGASPRKIEDISKIKGAVFGLYAGEDSGINATLPSVLEQVINNKTNFQMKLFPGAYHAYFNHTGMSYNEKASEISWDMVKQFYERYLHE